ncbi:hypothetical protein [Caballeronia grimmiae]|uniref:hypothetical protein n=1 Tax=Caballeronia grimmiae TaxID=1071679 RepID=UPI0038B84351
MNRLVCLTAERDKKCLVASTRSAPIFPTVIVVLPSNVLAEQPFNARPSQASAKTLESTAMCAPPMQFAYFDVQKRRRAF